MPNKDQVEGKAKEAVGDLTDNPRLEGEGRLQQAKGNVKRAGEKVGDAIENLADEAKDVVDRAR